MQQLSINLGCFHTTAEPFQPLDFIEVLFLEAAHNSLLFYKGT
jgi:hypothetical protein